jgi:DNA polymerase-3 subunit epsilon
MLTRLSLRVRIFLMFALLAGGNVMATGLGLLLGYRQVDAVAWSGFVAAGIIAAFAITAVTAGIWLLFDENVAKPIMRLSTQLRARAHAGVRPDLSDVDCRYLGDLAPAAQAMTQQLDETAMGTASAVAEATARLNSERERLLALLSEIPVATILVNPAHRIVLYDGQAAGVLAGIAPPRLHAPIFDYLDRTQIEAAHRELTATGETVSFEVASSTGEQTFQARLKPLDNAPGYMLLLDEAETTLAPAAQRPLVYDFDLLDREVSGRLEEQALRDLAFVVFDTETTGLTPHQDEIVQIGAVRVLHGRIVEGEALNLLVDPGRRIPASASRVHGITDDMVAGAPDIGEAGRQLHSFARDAVLVAHNAPFDMAFLKRHAHRIGATFDQPVLDTVLLSAVIYGTTESHSLDALCQRLGVEIPEDLRHTALGDARATAAALCALLPMLEARGLTHLGDVLRETRKHGRLLEDLNA